MRPSTVLLLYAVVTCCVNGCPNSKASSRKIYRHVTYHRFPVDTNRRRRWIEALAKGKKYVPRSGDRVCSLHFSMLDVTSKHGVKKLRRTATPQKFVDHSTNDIGVCATDVLFADAAMEVGSEIEICTSAGYADRATCTPPTTGQLPHDHQDYCSLATPESAPLNRDPKAAIASTTSLHRRVTKWKRLAYYHRTRMLAIRQRYKTLLTESSKKSRLQAVSSIPTEILNISGGMYTSVQKTFANRLH
jgi:hypothetical protein